jgi:4-amino-4-deoxy-L-arabinose transferase-like glycosyltransferase
MEALRSPARGREGYFLLIAVCLLSLVIRLWLLDKRWVNPDEGAHLMDAVLVLDGKVPEIDFASRQPFYVYTVAAALKLFGTTYTSGRLLSVICSTLIGGVIFLLARSLFDARVGMLSAALFLMLPFEVVQSALVKTEPLAVLLTCLAVYGTCRFLTGDERGWLVAAGAFCALAFYVRQSAVVVPLVIGIPVALRAARVREAARSLGLLFAGYGAVVLAVLAFYSRFIDVTDLIWRKEHPLGFLSGALARLLAAEGAPLASPFADSQQASTISWVPYYNFLGEALHLNAFLVLGLVFSIVQFGWRLRGQDRRVVREYMLPRSILYVWISLLAVAYGVQFYTRGFFVDYFREFLPPLVIIFAAWVCNAIPAFERKGVLERFIMSALCLSALVFYLQAQYKDLYGIGHHASLAIALMTVFALAPVFESSARRFAFVSIFLGIVVFIVVSRYIPWKAYFSGALPSLSMIGVTYGLAWALLRHDVWRVSGGYGTFVCLSLVMATFVVSLSFSATRLDATYTSAWSPKSVEKVASYLKANTSDSDEVISGALIWEVQASRRPFLMISHPLMFEDRISEDQRAAIARNAATHPPRVIILDGYTEMTYVRQVPQIMDLIRARYDLAVTTEPPGYVVRVYRLRDQAPASRDAL